MICKIKTWYKHYGRQGSARGCLTLRLETDNLDFRDKVYAAVRKALADEPEEKEQKPDVMGFHVED